MSNKLDQAYTYYINNKTDIVSEYLYQYIAIDDKKIIVNSKEKISVIQEMLDKGYEMGDFLVQYVTTDEEQIQRFYSRFV